MDRIRFEHYDLGFFWKYTLFMNIPHALFLAYSLKVRVCRFNIRAACGRSRLKDTTHCLVSDKGRGIPMIQGMVIKHPLG